MEEMEVVGRYRGNYPSIEDVEKWVQDMCMELIDYMPEIMVMS